jgi:hypothetical protein
MIFVRCLFLFLVVNPDDYREDHRQCEATLNRLAPGVFGVCFPRFTFCFHVQFAAKQH